MPIRCTSSTDANLGIFHESAIAVYGKAKITRLNGTRRVEIMVGHELADRTIFTKERRHISRQQLELAAVDCMAILAVGQIAMNRQVDRVADRADRSVAHRHVKSGGMGTAEKVSTGID